MATKTNQTGFGEKYQSSTKRVINKDGSFNIIKEGAERRSLYQYLIEVSWGRFWLYVIAFYLTINAFFAALYLWAGIEGLAGVEGHQGIPPFFEAFFFSVQTFTAVGYGAVAPAGFAVNMIATLEAMVGLIGFALCTGLFYGRFSFPRHSIRFSKQAIITKDEEGQKALHFQIVNRKPNVLMEMEASVVVKFSRKDGERFQREFYNLELAISRIKFFPLNWRIVHKIDPESPLYNLDEEQAAARDLELLILIKGFDSSFNQVTHARHSYVAGELLFNARFKPAYRVSKAGDTLMDIESIDDYETLDKP